MLEIKEISKSFHNKTVLSDISFLLEMKESIGIQGATGSGKTTLLRIIAGLEYPDSGNIILDNEIISSNKYMLEPSRRNMGFVFQRPSLWPHLTVKQNIEFGLNNYSRKEKEIVSGKLMHELKVNDIQNSYPSEISGGESRLVAIARSLAPEPPLLLLDEPLVNLNEELKDVALQFLVKYIKEKETTTIYVSHNILESLAITNRIIKLEKGEMTNSF